MKYRRFFLAMAAMVLLSSLASLISPLLLQLWTAAGAALGPGRILTLVGIMAAVCLFQLLMTWCRETFAKDFNKHNALTYLGCYFRMDYDAIRRTGAAALVDRVLAAVNAVYAYMTGPAITLWADLITALACLLVIGHGMPLAAAVLLLMVPLNYFGYRSLNRELSRRSVQLSKVCGESAQTILSRCRQVDYLKQCPGWGDVLEELKAPLERSYAAMRDVNVFAQTASQTITSVNAILQTLAMLLVSYRAVEGAELSAVVVCSILLPIYGGKVSAITNANLARKQYEANLQLIREMEAQEEAEGTEPLEEVREVRFACESLTVGEGTIPGPYRAAFRRGDVVWVKGPSGCGKSTLMKLLPGLRSQEGVFLNGRDIRCYKKADLRRRVNYLSQEVPVIQGTVEENLFFNRPPSAAEAADLAREPLLAGILASHAMGDPIEDGGGNLSGGERQKLAIARMLHSSADVWILDEITSSIDQEAAVEILERLMERRRESLIFIISHDGLPAPYANWVWDLETSQVTLAAGEMS